VALSKDLLPPSKGPSFRAVKHLYIAVNLR